MNTRTGSNNNKIPFSEWQNCDFTFHCICTYYSGAMLIFYISMIWYGMVFVCYGMLFLCYAMRY